MAVISFSGLATGLDTNAIVDKLVQLERQRSVGVLETQQAETTRTQTALQTMNSKILAFLSAVDKLKDASGVLARTATSSDATVLNAKAAAGAPPGSTTITVSELARPAIATSAAGPASVTATVATGTGTFSFRVGTGDAQSVPVDATTTLEGLSAAINALGAGASASIVNVGTTAAPSYKLRLASDEVGTPNAVSIVADDTTLGMSVTQSAANATFTVSGFTDPLERESNSFGDVLPGVTVNLTAKGGPVTVTVATDSEAVAGKVDAVVKAFNDLVTYVSGQSAVTQDTSSGDRAVTIGPLALDSTARTVVQSLHDLVSSPVEGLDGQYTLLAEIGVTTNRDGTLAFDADKLTEALAEKDVDVAALFGGSGTVGGVADRLSSYMKEITGAKGIFQARLTGVATEISGLEDRIAAGERSVSAFEENLRAQFASLEVLVSNLQSQGSFLISALGRSLS